MLPSTARAEKKLSRRVRLGLLLAGAVAISAPTVYLLRAPMARADETAERAPTPAQPVDIPMIESQPAEDSRPVGRLDAAISEGVPGPLDEQPLPAAARKVENVVETLQDPDEALRQTLAPRIEERIVREQVEVAPGKVETVERRIQLTVAPASAAPKAPHKIEFLPEPSEDEQKILKAISAPTTVEFEDIPLNDALDFLRTQNAIEIQLDTAALEDAGLSADMRVTLKSKGLPLRSTLRRMLPRDVTFYVDDDVLMITSQEKADSMLVTRTYPIGDLLSNTVEAAVAQPAQPVQPPQQAAPGAAPAGGMGGGVARRIHYAVPQSYTRLTQAITSTISPDNWDELGGSASIVAVPEARSLVISQTHAAHDDVVRLLRSLRAARAIGDHAAQESAPRTYAPALPPTPASAPASIGHAQPTLAPPRPASAPLPSASPRPALAPSAGVPVGLPAPPRAVPTIEPKEVEPTAEPAGESGLAAPKAKERAKPGGGGFF